MGAAAILVRRPHLRNWRKKMRQHWCSTTHAMSRSYVVHLSLRNAWSRVRKNPYSKRGPSMRIREKIVREALGRL